MTLGKIFGVTIRLNTFFLIILSVYITLGVLPKGLIAFGIVLLHEMAHVVVARSYGIAVKEVELLPFGGVARLEGNMEMDPQTEIYISLAGPLSNLFLVILAFFMWEKGYWNSILTPYFIKCNVLIGLFNLLPAMPLDGGHIYRAYLARRVGLKRATAKAAGLGQLLAVVITVAGLVGLYLGFNTVNIIVVALFLFYAAGLERKTAMFLFMKHLNRKKEELQQKGILPAHTFVTIGSTPLKEVLANIVPHKFYLVYVLNEKLQLNKILTETELIKAMLELGINTPVGDVVKK